MKWKFDRRQWREKSRLSVPIIFPILVLPSLQPPSGTLVFFSFAGARVDNDCQALLLGLRSDPPTLLLPVCSRSASEVSCWMCAGVRVSVTSCPRNIMP